MSLAWDLSQIKWCSISICACRIGLLKSFIQLWLSLKSGVQFGLLIFNSIKIFLKCTTSFVILDVLLLCLHYQQCNSWLSSWIPINCGFPKLVHDPRSWMTCIKVKPIICISKWNKKNSPFEGKQSWDV
jgi:hypothetical protein